MALIPVYSHISFQNSEGRSTLHCHSSSYDEVFKLCFFAIYCWKAEISFDSGSGCRHSSTDSSMTPLAPLVAMVNINSFTQLDRKNYGRAIMMRGTRVIILMLPDWPGERREAAPGVKNERIPTKSIRRCFYLTLRLRRRRGFL